MQVYKRSLPLFLRNEALSWLWTILFLASVFLGIFLLRDVQEETIVMMLVVCLLIKLGDSLTQFYVTGVTIDTVSDQLRLEFKSRFSGMNARFYDLSQTRFELINNTGLQKLFFPDIGLKIVSAGSEIYLLSPRHGFAVSTLTEIYLVLQNRETITESAAPVPLQDR